MNRTAIKWGFIAAIALPVLWVGANALGWLGQAATVVREEVAPRTILDRYQWFIEQWHAIEEQDATLMAYKDAREAARTEYGTDIPMDVRRELAQQSAEIRGILANRNRLAAEYRAAIQKINYQPATMLPHFPETVPNLTLK